MPPLHWLNIPATLSWLVQVIQLRKGFIYELLIIRWGVYESTLLYFTKLLCNWFSMMLWSDTDDTPYSLSVYYYIYYVCIQNCTYTLSKQSAPKSNGYSKTNKICLPITFYLKLVFRIINILLQFKHAQHKNRPKTHH